MVIQVKWSNPQLLNGDLGENEYRVTVRTLVIEQFQKRARNIGNYYLKNTKSFKEIKMK